MNYSRYKLPLWSKFNNRGVGRFLCKMGLHKPVKAEDSNRNEVFCQVCMKSLTNADWEKFWKSR